MKRAAVRQPGAGHHKAERSGRDVFTAGLQALPHRHTQTGLIATKKGINAFLHLAISCVTASYIGFFACHAFIASISFCWAAMISVAIFLSIASLPNSSSTFAISIAA